MDIATKAGRPARTNGSTFKQRGLPGCGHACPRYFIFCQVCQTTSRKHSTRAHRRRSHIMRFWKRITQRHRVHMYVMFIYRTPSIKGNVRNDFFYCRLFYLRADLLTSDSLLKLNRRTFLCCELFHHRINSRPIATVI